MNEEKKVQAQNVKLVSLNNLYLDPNNFRLIHEPEYKDVPESKIKDKTVAQRTFKMIAGANTRNVQDIIESFVKNGYLTIEQILVRELQNGEYIVLDGNRRVAALTILAREYTENHMDLMKLDPSIFDNLPVLIGDHTVEIDVLTGKALESFIKAKKWDEWTQAVIFDKLVSFHNVSEEEICERFNIKKIELRTYLRAMALIKQYRNSDYGDQFDKSKFQLFKEVIRNEKLKMWLGWDDSEYNAKNIPNMNLLFSWMSMIPCEDHSNNDRVHPIIYDIDDIARVGIIIEYPQAIDQLKKKRNTKSVNLDNEHFSQNLKEHQGRIVRLLKEVVGTMRDADIHQEHILEVEEYLGDLRKLVNKKKALSLGSEPKKVSQNGIVSHFDVLDIVNYKRLRNLKLEKLSRINIIAGINNSGKTSLLESIYLLVRQNDFDGLLEIVRRRGKIHEDQLDPEWTMEQVPHEIDIQGIFNGQQASVSFQRYTENADNFDKALYLETVKIHTNYAKDEQDSVTRIYKGRNRETFASMIRMLCPSVFSSPFFLNEHHRYAWYYEKSFQLKVLPRIIEFIEKCFIPTLSDIRLVDKWQRFLASDKNFDGAPDLTSYGEGLQRVFFIALTFAAAQNGIVLIDEFENAIHTKLIPNFAKFIFALTKEFNVQLFLTSHSKECIDAFVFGIPYKESNDFTAIALVEEPGTKNIVAREIPGKEYRDAVDAGNVDLRKAR